jgi:nicotinamide-nucleotide amidase
MYYDEQAKQSIIRFFAQRQVAMADNNLRQALTIEGADVLLNERGLAIGLAIKHNGCSIILLPGPPSELKSMFDHHVIPWIFQHYSNLQKLHAKMLCFAGIGESGVAARIADLIDHQTDPTIATYAREGEVQVRVASKKEQNLEPIVLEIMNRLKDYLYAYEDQTIEQALVDRCLLYKKSIVIAESCTGGRIAHFITSIPGSSQVFTGGFVTYSNDSKTRWLNISDEDLHGPQCPGAISSETAKQMANAALNNSKADYALSITGVAGPSEVEGKPVGLIYIALANRAGQCFVEEHRLAGTRSIIQQRAAKLSIYKLWQFIKK